MKLVIVESPTKAKTISKFLGKDYAVESSYGHIRDLPKSKLGVDVEHNFEPHYVIPVKAKPVVKDLQAKAKKADLVILATDEDREGEAIAWHLTHALGLLPDAKQRKNANAAKNDSRHSNEFVVSNRVQRIAFHEITKSAIEEALKTPREIDINLVDAQQARRMLDRLVGYGLSPFIWRKVRYGLSAGRVQSVALRLIVEREREIEKFRKEEYWTIEADFAKQATRDKKQETKTFRAKLQSLDGKSLGKMDVSNEATAKKLAAEAKNKKYQVSSVSRKNINRTPAPPFTTSTMQQEAARKLGFSAKQTMVVAQQLYENGFITYMRTDSTNLAASALAQAKEVVSSYFGAKYALAEPRRYATKSKGAQEAHEAIRPTDLAKKSGEEAGLKDRGQRRLYDLIWKRTIASQMQAAELEQTSADIGSDDERFSFRASGQVVKFDGFIRVYTEGSDEPEEREGILPPLEEGEKLALKAIEPLQHFTEPPPRYTDATLIKTLEADGIGRPSTYAPTLSTIQYRGYVTKTEKKYYPTDIGIVVNDLLVEHFPEVIDIKFTSHIEEEFDLIAEGKIKWTEVLREFYTPFKKHLDAKEEEVKKHIEISDTPCPHCGKMMIVKFGRMGKFLACPDPETKITLPMPEEAAKIKALAEKTKDERCPICGKPMEVKRSRFGYFLGCVDYPKCKGIAKILTRTGFKCPKCLASPERKDSPGDVVEKKSRGRGKVFYACSRYPDCDFAMNKKPESEADLVEAMKNQAAKNKKTKKQKSAIAT